MASALATNEAATCRGVRIPSENPAIQVDDRTDLD
jgi:hypothetical protein